MYDKATSQNKTAWEHRAYEARVNMYGTPQELAREIINNPKGKLRYHANYFNNIDGKNIASICGSDGRRAVAVALQKANATVFDISEPQKKYALELAEAAGVKIGYEVGDFCDTDIVKYGEQFAYGLTSVSLSSIQGGSLKTARESLQLLQKRIAKYIKAPNKIRGFFVQSQK